MGTVASVAANEDRSMSNDYQYTVDGDKVTLDEIVARCPLVSRATVSNRVRLGWRTWAELSKRPDVVQSNRRKGARR